MKFTDFPLHEATQRALEAMGFEDTTPVQAETLPTALEGRDLIAQAQTGTGKTAAFGIALVEAAHQGRRGIVLTPTRELAQQVQRELQAIGKGSPVDVVCLIGGASFPDQVRSLQHHPEAILVATPGRVVDHLQRGTLDLSGMSILTLDEADEMMSMGFQDELDAIVSTMPEERQTLLFTATLPPSIERLAKKALKDPVTVRASGGNKGAARSVEQCFAVVKGQHRADAVRRFLAIEEPKAALLFCRTRDRVQQLADELKDLDAEALHGGMGQPARDGVMRRFREGRTKLLVATDVAARGLDVEDIELVIHDEPATDAEVYIHRVGRTGRAGRTGKSILFLSPGAMRRLGAIQHVAGRLEKIEVPTDETLAALKVGRVVEDLKEVQPGPSAFEAFDQALHAGLDPKQIALAALDLLVATVETQEEAPKTDGTVALAFKVGKIDGLRPGDLVGMLANEGGLRGDDVGRIDILEKMSVAEIPASEAERVIERLTRSQCRGQWVRPRPAEDWRFKSEKR